MNEPEKQNDRVERGDEGEHMSTLLRLISLQDQEWSKAATWLRDNSKDDSALLFARKIRRRDVASMSPIEVTLMCKLANLAMCELVIRQEQESDDEANELKGEV